MANLQALKAAIKLLADAAKDAKAGVGVIAYSNLLPDVMALLPQLGEIPVEAKQLVAADYLSLIQELTVDLAITDAHAEAVINASLKLLQDLVLVVLPDAEALLAAAKGQPAAPSA